MIKLDMKNLKNIKKLNNIKKRCENCKYYLLESYGIFDEVKCIKHNKYLPPFWDNEPCLSHSLKIPNKVPKLHMGNLSIYYTTFSHLKN